MRLGPLYPPALGTSTPNIKECCLVSKWSKWMLICCLKKAFKFGAFKVKKESYTGQKQWSNHQIQVTLFCCVNAASDRNIQEVKPTSNIHTIIMNSSSTHIFKNPNSNLNIYNNCTGANSSPRQKATLWTFSNNKLWIKTQTPSDQNWGLGEDSNSTWRYWTHDFKHKAGAIQTTPKLRSKRRDTEEIRGGGKLDRKDKVEDTFIKW